MGSVNEIRLSFLCKTLAAALDKQKNLCYPKNIL